MIYCNNASADNTDNCRKQYFSAHGFGPATVYIGFDRDELQMCLLLKQFIS